MKLRLRWTLLIAAAVIAFGGIAWYVTASLDTSRATPSTIAEPTRGNSQRTHFRAEPPIPPLGDGATLEEVLSAWEASRARLRSYDIYVTVEDHSFLGINDKPRDAPLVRSRSSRQVFSLGKRRFETDETQSGVQATSIAIWDGHRVINHWVQGNQISVAKSFQPDPTCDYEELIFSAMSRPYPVMLRERLETELVGREDGLFVVYTPTTLTAVRPTHMSPFGYRFWLDPARGCLPAKVQTLYPESDKEIVYAEDENELREIAMGVWAPVAVRMRIFQSGPSLGSERTLTVDLAISTFNAEIPDAIFELDPP